MDDGKTVRFEAIFQVGDKIAIEEKFKPGDQMDIKDVRQRDRKIIIFITRANMTDDDEPLEVTATEADWQRLLDTKKADWPFSDIGPGMLFEYTENERFEQIPV